MDYENNVYIEKKVIGFSGNKMAFKDQVLLFPMRFDELFGCHRKFKDEREIKGIYYSKIQNAFYVFVNRFYLKIVDDGQLIKKGFSFDDRYYNRALSLKLVSKSGYPTMEILKTKWVKTLRLKSYLVTHYDTFAELDSFKFNENDFFMMITGNSIVRCDFQTLSIDDNVFCFDTDE